MSDEALTTPPEADRPPELPKDAPEEATAPEPTAPEPIAPEPTAPEPTAPEPIAPEPTAPEPTPRPDIQVHIFGRTDVGQVREHNEDNFLVADLTRGTRGLMEADRTQTIGERGAVFGVCDGMGGAAAGDRKSVV